MADRSAVSSTTESRPITITTTKSGYDFTYSGSDGSASYTYQLNLTPDIVLRYDASKFDVGNDEIGWNMGYRNIKFYPDSTSTSRNQNNDIPVFRYSRYPANESGGYSTRRIGNPRPGRPVPAPTS
ncbi:hypothetical protein ACQ86N_21505 [Puia sp. P3]|uniref:hypothetical protein n=1 Tax=Puia sp. P3 TaxID=3423952 RepID=UPI003D67EE7C